MINNVHKYRGHMKKDFRDFLDEWPRNFIHDKDLATQLSLTSGSRHNLIYRAIKAGRLTRLKPGLYIITNKTKHISYDQFELALVLYESSMISMESALSYHNWIPEAVYTYTSATSKRGREFRTPLGMFSYEHVPEKNLYLGVARRVTKTGIAFIADPWRALADFIYIRHRSWPNLKHLEMDLRIELYSILESDLTQLETLCSQYPSPRVRAALTIFFTEIINIKRDNS